MLRSLYSLNSMPIQALDGEIGAVSDFYFDDQDWVVRYMVADTGGWLSGRRVVISPAAIGTLSGGVDALPVNLTKKQIEESPSLSLDEEISREQEEELARYYGWPSYWGEYTGMVNSAAYGAVRDSRRSAGVARESHLRSVGEVTGYHIQAEDGEIGHVEDFIADTDLWVIRYLAVATRNWLPGRKVLLAPNWIREVSWHERKVFVDLTREVIRESPEYDPGEAVNRQYETGLYDYYGRKKYWT